MCDQVCGQKNLSGKNASLYSGRSPKIFTKNLSLKNLKPFLKTFKFSIFLIYIYKIFLGPFLGGRCRYYPSCSNYSIECYQKFNFLKATYLTFKRISSCHPFSSQKSYYDPVPFNSLNQKGLF